MVFKKLKEKWNRAYEAGRAQWALDIGVLMLDGSFIALPYGSDNTQNEEFVRSTATLIKKGTKEITEERKRYNFLERIAYNRGYKRV